MTNIKQVLLILLLLYLITLPVYAQKGGASKSTSSKSYRSLEKESGSSWLKYWIGLILSIVGKIFAPDIRRYFAGGKI
jgi:hypothetical protein